MLFYAVAVARLAQKYMPIVRVLVSCRLGNQFWHPFHVYAGCNHLPNLQTHRHKATWGIIINVDKLHHHPHQLLARILVDMNPHAFGFRTPAWCSATRRIAWVFSIQRSSNTVCTSSESECFACPLWRFRALTTSKETTDSKLKASVEAWTETIAGCTGQPAFFPKWTPQFQLHGTSPEPQVVTLLSWDEILLVSLCFSMFLFTKTCQGLPSPRPGLRNQVGSPAAEAPWPNVHRGC